MALIKKRPTISLIAPRWIRSGSTFEVQVILNCEKVVPVDGVEVVLEGRGGYVSQSQHGQHDNATHFLRLRAVPEGSRELKVGRHAYRVRFSVPADAPSTFRGDLVFVDYTVKVRVDIPWWPDARATFALRTVGAETAQEPSTHVYVTHRDGPPGRKPYFEVSMGSARIEPGGTLQGAVSLANIAHNDYRNIVVSLVAEQTVKTTMGTTATNTCRVRWKVAPTELSEGAAIQFRLKVPEDAGCSFNASENNLNWSVEVHLDIPLWPDWVRDHTITVYQTLLF